VGPQQGDPFGPLLFCLSIHPLLQSLSSSLSIGFLDDVILGDDATSVAKDVDSVRLQGESIGLCLNVSKCELITHSDNPLADNLDAFARFKPPDASILRGKCDVTSRDTPSSCFVFIHNF